MTMVKTGKFALVLAAVYVLSLGAVALLGAALWADLDEGGRAAIRSIVGGRAIHLLGAALLLVAALAFVVWLLFERYVTAPLELADATRFILNGNPSHRLEPKGSAELGDLARAINSFAAQHEALQRDVESRISEANKKLEEERNRLAALIEESTQSVLVCNIEGRILLYNSRARQLLGQPAVGHAGVAGGALVGLGRSVFAIFERSLVAHALEMLQARLLKGTPNPVARFVTAAARGQLLRVHMAPVLGPPQTHTDTGGDGEGARDRTITGFLLVIDDVTKAMEAASRIQFVLESLTEASRRALGNIRAAVETLLSYPGMDQSKQARFIEVISQEAAGLSATLDRSAREYDASFKAEWLLEDMLGADLISAARKRIESGLGLHTASDEIESSLWLKVDSYSLVRAITSIAKRLKDEFGVRELRFRLKAAGRLAHLDIVWSGATATSDALARWESQPLGTRDEGFPLTLKDVVERHEGALWHQADRALGTGFFRLLIPVTRPEQAALSVPTPAQGRPEYYDFDLFHQAGQTPELDQRKLTDLAYTVFDTETTGLRPSDGDEIISIGAVRIVNGRLLHQEAFDQFIDPKRSVSLETVRVTGIDPAILNGQPTIDAILPQFHRFCEDTVLVAHNAAFDMRFLQLKEERTGVRFTQPVLDTLLLGAVVQPNVTSTSLEDVAARFGVPVLGRHTALGDAMMTGEIFLKMIPLLVDRGILTLKDAREASEKTYYARLRY